MSGANNSGHRRHSRHDNSLGLEVATNEIEQDDSMDDESPGNPRTNSTPFRDNRKMSSYSIKNSRRRSKKIPDETEDDEVDPKKMSHTVTKYEPRKNENNDESAFDSVDKIEEYEMSDYTTKNIEKRESDSPDDNVTTRDTRRKSRKSRIEQESSTAIFESNRGHDHEDHEIAVRSSARDTSSRQTSKKSRSDGARKSRRRKKTRSRDNIEKELPITEILRKSQETTTRTRYEEPLPLQELTTDTIYVQGRKGFSAIKISGDRKSGVLRGLPREPKLYPIKVAIFVQTIWNSTGMINQGLLAGIALMHFLLIQTFFKQTLDFLVDYSLVSELYTNIFSFLVVMCTISAFDKFDLAHLDLLHLRQIYIDYSHSFLAVPLYIATFCLHCTSILIDDKISLIRYTGNTTELESNCTVIITEEEFDIWHKVTITKDGLAILAWLFIALGPREDLFLTHLKDMEKYSDDGDSNR